MTNRKYDSLGARDLDEQRQQGKLPDPADASPLTDKIVRSKRIGVPWLYDYTHGWTPQTEAAEPRPKVQFPPYYLESFPLETFGPEDQAHYALTVDLRAYPTEGTRVYLVVPGKVLPAEWWKPDAPFFRAVAPAAKLGEFNTFFGTSYTNSQSAKEVVLELVPGRRAAIDGLKLFDPRTRNEPPRTVTLRVCIVLATEKLRPKTASFIHFEQRMDGRLMGSFDHHLHAYHRYDLPIVGDLRTRLAYRRTDKAVMDIPEEAIACFDSWDGARAAGFDVAPLSFRRHYRRELVSNELAQAICDYFNDPKLTAKKIHQDIADNPWVNELGQALSVPIGKRGVSLKVAERILKRRDELEKRARKRSLAGRGAKGAGRPAAREGVKGFTSLEQLDRVAGVGKDTLSDIITSLLYKQLTKRARRAQKDPRAKSGWQADPRIVRLLKKVR